MCALQKISLVYLLVLPRFSKCNFKQTTITKQIFVMWLFQLNKVPAKKWTKSKSSCQTRIKTTANELKKNLYRNSKQTRTVVVAHTYNYHNRSFKNMKKWRKKCFLFLLKIFIYTFSIAVIETCWAEHSTDNRPNRLTKCNVPAYVLTSLHEIYIVSIRSNVTQSRRRIWPWFLIQTISINSPNC